MKMKSLNKMSREEVVAMLVGGIGSIALGLGIYGLSTEDAGLLHPIFANRMFVLGLVGLGLVFMYYELKTLLPIWKAKRKTRQQ